MIINNYPQPIQTMFQTIRDLIFISLEHEKTGHIEEKLWAKLPSYYVEDRFIRIIPFKDHLNIEADFHPFKEQLSAYKMTPKGMMQLYVNQAIPEDLLLHVFRHTLKARY